MLTEMVMLGFIARKLYKRILPNQDNSVISTSHISTIGAIMSTDLVGNNNNSINYSNNNNNKNAETPNTAQKGYINCALDINEK